MWFLVFINSFISIGYVLNLGPAFDFFHFLIKKQFN